MLYQHCWSSFPDKMLPTVMFNKHINVHIHRKQNITLHEDKVKTEEKQVVRSQPYIFCQVKGGTYNN